MVIDLKTIYSTVKIVFAEKKVAKRTLFVQFPRSKKRATNRNPGLYSSICSENLDMICIPLQPRFTCPG